MIGVRLREPVLLDEPADQLPALERILGVDPYPLAHPDAGYRLPVGVEDVEL